MGQLRYEASVSHSHAVDPQPAPAVERGLGQLAHRCHEWRAPGAFFDTAGLVAQPALGTSIHEALG